MNEILLLSSSPSMFLTNIPSLAISRPWWAIPLTNVMAVEMLDSGSSAEMPMVRGYTDTTFIDSPMARAMSDIFPKKRSKFLG